MYSTREKLVRSAQNWWGEIFRDKVLYLTTPIAIIMMMMTMQRDSVLHFSGSMFHSLEFNVSLVGRQAS